MFQGPGLGLGLGGNVEVGPERLPYRLVVTTGRDPAVYPYSVRTSVPVDVDGRQAPVDLGAQSFSHPFRTLALPDHRSAV